MMGNPDLIGPPDVRAALYHFRKRVHERIGKRAAANLLWYAVITGIAQRDDRFVDFVARTDMPGRRVWRLRSADGRMIYVIFDHRDNIPVTLLKPGHYVRRRKGKSPRRLAG